MVKKLIYIIPFLLTAILTECGQSSVAQSEQKKDSVNATPPQLDIDKFLADREGQRISDSLKKASEEESLNGKILPNLEDSTILKIVYGSCLLTNRIFHKGYLQDSAEATWVYRFTADQGGKSDIQVENNFELKDGGRLIYLGGWFYFSDMMHDLYYETGLICEKCKGGWRIVDSYKDDVLPDDNGTVPVAEIGNIILLESSSSGDLNAFAHSDVGYEIITNKKFKVCNNSVGFILSDNYIGDMNPIPPDSIIGCNGYSDSGAVNFRFNDTLKAFVFYYNREEKNYGCTHEKIVHTQTEYEIRYMNTDTSFLGYRKVDSSGIKKVTCNYPKSKIKYLLSRPQTTAFY
jgi:hypothetical protein